MLFVETICIHIAKSNLDPDLMPAVLGLVYLAPHALLVRQTRDIGKARSLPVLARASISIQL